ncbi:uncharacterized protein LOC126980084 [Leptidea sinapis]|uniref:uncharacterized protein LOC126980084 n=1 Tax=Leptidea sinapis TaxID=189913 RepID=UPI0021C3CEE0|nr:uncharacterized protein LOC126980084 [Leptidea sinapis]
MAAKLIKSQAELIARLEKSLTNFKKSPKSRVTKSYVETRITILEDLYTEFKNNHRELIQIATTEQVDGLSYFKNDDFDTFEELYTEYVSELKEKLDIFQEKPSSVTNNPIYDEVKLPRIQLPSFSGKYEEWQTFHDMFVSLIHRNEKLSAVQKLHYLKSSISGEPESLLRNFPTTERNYEEAWKQLTKRYNNKRYNTNAIMKVLFAQKQTTSESSHSIKQLLDTTTACLKALNNMGIDTRSWDTIVIYIVVSRLDVESHKQWENQVSMLTEELPTWSQLVDFLEARFRSLEMIDSGKQTVKTSFQPKKQITKTKSFHTAVQQESKKPDTLCALCGDNHYLNLCKQFGKQTTQQRRELVQAKGLCFNCMQPTHVVNKCRQSTCCKKCGRRHHTMLHFDKEGSIENTHNSQEVTKTGIENTIQARTSTAEPRIVANFSKRENQSNNVLLATTLLKARSSNGERLLVRGLLDQGSQASFVTESAVQLLGLKRTSVNGFVSGLGDGQMHIKHLVMLYLESRHNPEFYIQVNAYVLGSLTSMLPCEKLDSPDWLEIEDLELADPNYATPGKIDILLGAEVYANILLEGMIKHPKGNLIAQNTAFGWVLSGQVSNSSSAKTKITSLHLQIKDNDDYLKRFWELEAEPDKIQKRLSKEEQMCETLYEATTIRDKDGRFIVTLPFTNEDPECQYGQSKDIAMRKLLALERRLNKNPRLYEEYRKVLREYVTLNHMALVEADDVDNPKAVYLPHHAVVRDDKETTKVRVVFNASSKGVNDVSLNDNLMVGPKIQQDLRHILMRWRTHPICIVADLVKMYRQVLVHPKHVNFQRILWRPSRDMPVQHYKLLTLTFGTACAPYLAVKSLQRLAEDEKSKFPVASEIAKNDYYIDDLMTGCETIQEGKIIYEEMNALMTSGGFELQKWSSNSQELLQYIRDDNHKNDKCSTLPIKTDNMVKVLGIQWNRESDNFEYVVNIPEVKYPITKRQVLSNIARLYDPMGWIAPVVIIAKILIQKIWKSQLDWDNPLTEDLSEMWLQFRKELVEIQRIRIPRWMCCSRDSRVELHAFSDASRAAYAAAVFIRVIDQDKSVHVNLVSAKTKVAPIEKEVSIPRLELCGAVLAAKLLNEISQVIPTSKENLYGWTDSTIVLAWLKGGSSKWSTFVSNRVSEILSIMDYDQWRHVSTETNPSDCASRGLNPSEMVSHDLWWHGPQWLREIDINVPNLQLDETHEEERIISMKVTESKEDFEWMRFSSLTKLLRVISYCWRIILPKTEREALPRFITVKEMNQTLDKCIKQAQKFAFNEEITLLANGKEIPKRSILHTLCPILDQKGLLRVGGRIDLANVSYDARHPIIIPTKSHLTQLLVSDAHSKTLHGGPQVMLNFIRSKYWIIRARDQVKKHFRRCIACLRHSKANRVQLMGQLPEARLKPCKPFKATGVDYAGPVNIKFSPGRGAKSYKGYICVFVCMVTRAIHIEAVTDLTSKGFIAAFRRFTSRRGHCQDLYSDNGTNFVGADNQLRDMFDRAKSNLPDEIAELLTLESTTWHFIPPQSPNFGGLWEAGVRCAKNHLKKVIGDSTLTYEELATVLSQIEACLNSRPISVISNEADDLLPLTPGHFLVGESLLNVSDESYIDCNTSRLDRWKLIQKIVRDFWQRWSKEYLCNLNQRYKWQSKLYEPKLNDVCIVRDDNIPPSKWILGKITQKHVGPDNVTRVVTLKCKNGFIKRPLSKISVLENDCGI